MPNRFVISHDSQVLYITVVTKHRLPVFRTDWMKEVVCDALGEARKSAGFLLFAYVIMIDHMHLLTSCPRTRPMCYACSKASQRVASSIICKENNHLRSLDKLQHQARDRNYKYSLWQTEKNVLPIFSEGMFMEKLNYIHQNPVRAGLVKQATDYRWSSARIWHGCPLENEPLKMDKELIYWRQSRPRR